MRSSTVIATFLCAPLCLASPSVAKDFAGPPIPGHTGPTGSPEAKTTVNNVAAFQGSSFTSGVQSVTILGYSAVGDRGLMNVRRVSSQPLHPWKFRSTDHYLPDGSTSNTNGGWWEGYATDGNLNIEQFGGVADANPNNYPVGTDNYQAITNALAYMKATGYGGWAAPQVGTYTLNFGLGTYFVGQTIHINVIATLRGLGSGISGSGAATSLMFIGSNGPGIIIETDGVTSPHGTMLKGIGIRTPLQGYTADYVTYPYDGILAHSTPSLEDVSVSGFPRDCVYILANSGSPPPSGGEANLFFINKLDVGGCGRDGLHIEGSDVNASTAFHVSAIGNGRWGVYDNSFLGVTHIGHHAAANGYGGAVVTTYTRDGANVYIPIIGQEAAAQTSQPSKSPTAWTFSNVRGIADPRGYWSPLWGEVIYNNVVYDVVPGQEANMWTSRPDTHPAVWRANGGHVLYQQYITWHKGLSPYSGGGPYRLPGISNIIGPYAEGGQPPSHFDGPTYIIGGVGVFNDGTGLALGTSGNNMLLNQGYMSVMKSGSNMVTANTGGDPVNSVFFTMGTTDATPVGHWRLRATANKDLIFDYAFNGVGFVLFGPNTASKMWGGGTPPSGSVAVPNIFIGEAAHSRRVTFADSPPTTGTWSQGDRIFNDFPAVGRPKGWICTVSGTPGTWVSEGNL